MQIPDQLNPEELDLLITKLRSGDDSVKERLVLHYYRLAFSISKKFCKTYGRRHYDSLVSSALFTIVKCIDQAKDVLKDNDLTKYLVCRIHWSLIDTVWSDLILKIPLRQLKQFNLKRKNSNEIKSIVDPQKSWTEVNDLIPHLVKTDEEREILRLRLEGHTYKEIAKRLGTYEVYVLRVFKTLRKRYNAKL